ncbi:MAG: Sec-independent protein translocase protein TatB [Desulfobulbaceae bacterium]|nr:Sec-independent protein translocase protein TatB [Desulfobulbaceae bacterium]
MFGIGLPEMIVILAVALIVVGPDKLPDMARSVAKWMFELKKTVNQVKDSLADEDNLIGSVHSDLKKTAGDLKGNLLESDKNFDWYEPGTPSRSIGEPDSDVIDTDELKPLDESPEKSGPDQEVPETGQLEKDEKTQQSGPGEEKETEGSPDNPAG